MDGMKPGEIHLGPASCEIGICAAVPPERRPHVREITKLWVQPGQRRNGHGTALLEALCEQADAESVALLVHVEPFRDAIDASVLAKWYGQHGFLPINFEPFIMVRPWKTTAH